MTLSRIDPPCPCGSGRRLRHCHGAPDRGRGADAARAQVYRGLMALAAEPRFARAWRRTRERLVDESLDEEPSPELRGALEGSDVARANFAAHLCLDIDAGDGRCLAERYGDEHGDDLDPDGRRFLDALIAARPSLFEVTAVSHDGELHLRDLRTGDTVRVDGEGWSGQVRPGTLLATRAVERPGGGLGLEGVRVPFPPDLAESVTEEAAELLHAVHDTRSEGWRELAADFLLHLHRLWVSEVVVRGLDPVVDPDDLVPIACWLRFRVRDREALRAVVRRRSEFVETAPGHWDWIDEERQGEAAFRGRVTWHGTWLALEAATREDAEDFEETLLRAAPGALFLRSVEFLDPVEEGEGQPARGPRAWWAKRRRAGDRRQHHDR